MNGSDLVHDGALDAALLVVRIVLGLGMASHGAQKLFGWFGGHGLRGTGAFFETMGFRPGTLFAGMAGLGEFGGGLLLAVGLAGPVGPAVVVVTMVVAMRVAHRGKGFFATSGGIELPLAYAAGIGGFAVIGHGAYAVDRWLGLASFWTPGLGWTALAIGVVAGFVIPMFRSGQARSSETS